MMKKAKQFLFLAACAMLLSGCSLLTTDEKSNEPISGIPFQEDEDGEWGMMSPSGEIIFVPQLESQPHRAYCDRFFMKEEDGLYSLYAAETIPYKVNGGYLGVNHFIKDRAVVVKPGEPIIIIDKDGNTVKTLDTVDGKDVLRVKVAEDGRMRVETKDHAWGLLDADGTMLLPPRYGSLWYDNGLVLSNPIDEKKWSSEFLGVPEKMTDHIMNIKGEESGIIKGTKYITTAIVDNGRYLVAYKTRKDDEKSFGIIDLTGSPVVRPSNDYEKITDVLDGKFVYFDGEQYGMSTLTGETVLEAEYDRLWMLQGSDMVLADEGEEEDRYVGHLLDKSGKAVNSRLYLIDSALSFDALDGEHALLHTADSIYVIIDRDGKEIPNMPYACAVSSWDRTDDYVETGVADVDDLVESLDLTIKGFRNVELTMTPTEFFKAMKEETHLYMCEAARDRMFYRRSQLKDMIEDDADAPEAELVYDLTDSEGNMTLKCFYDGIIYYCTPKYANNIVKQTELGEYNYEYSYTTQPMETLEVYFNNRNLLKGRIDLLYKSLLKKVKPMGKVIEESDGYIMVYKGNDMLELRKDTNCRGVSLCFTLIPKDSEPSTSYAAKQAKLRSGLEEDCPVILSK